MNAQERLRVERLVMRIAQQPDRPKDKDAERELATLMRVRPDAPYLLMELALILEMSLEQAQVELEQLRRGQYAGPPPGYAQPYAQPYGQSPRAPHYGSNTYPSGRGMGSRFSGMSGSGGFLRNAAAMAAGVVGGSLLFQGLGNMFDQDEVHHHYGGEQDTGGMQDMGSAGPASFDSGALGDAGSFGGDESDWV